LFEEFQRPLCEDFLYARKADTLNAYMINAALCDIQNSLEQHSKSLANYPNMPLVNEHYDVGDPKEIQQETSYHIIDDNVNLQIRMLNKQQKKIFDVISEVVNNRSEHLYFIDAPGGTGKTFLLNVLLDYVRLKGLLIYSPLCYDKI
jgi:hypothetical protein